MEIASRESSRPIACFNGPRHGSPDTDNQQIRSDAHQPHQLINWIPSQSAAEATDIRTTDSFHVINVSGKAFYEKKLNKDTFADVE